MTEKIVSRSALWLKPMKISLSFPVEGLVGSCQIPSSSLEDFGVMMSKISIFMIRVEKLLRDELRPDQVLSFYLRLSSVDGDQGENFGIKFEINVTLGHEGKRGGVAIDQSLGYDQLFLYPKGFIFKRLRKIGGSGIIYSPAPTVAKMVVSILKEQLKS
ncbi:MAG: hypothetical protein WC893_02045 [Candidatus Paceibacterota bacterium]|jgi:hypothetical protein